MIRFRVSCSSVLLPKGIVLVLALLEGSRFMALELLVNCLLANYMRRQQLHHEVFAVDSGTSGSQPKPLVAEFISPKKFTLSVL